MIKKFIVIDNQIYDAENMSILINRIMKKINEIINKIEDSDKKDDKLLEHGFDKPIPKRPKMQEFLNKKIK